MVLVKTKVGDEATFARVGCGEISKILGKSIYEGIASAYIHFHGKQIGFRLPGNKQMYRGSDCEKHILSSLIARNNGLIGDYVHDYKDCSNAIFYDDEVSPYLVAQCDLFNEERKHILEFKAPSLSRLERILKLDVKNDEYLERNLIDKSNPDMIHCTRRQLIMYINKCKRVKEQITQNQDKILDIYESEYMYQIQGQLLVTGAKVCTLAIYIDDFESDGGTFYTGFLAFRNIYPNEEIQKEIISTVNNYVPQFIDKVWHDDPTIKEVLDKITDCMDKKKTYEESFYDVEKQINTYIKNKTDFPIYMDF